jgi:hypothetical protein
LRAFLTAAVFYCIDRFIMSLFSANSTVPHVVLLAIDIILIFYPGLRAKEFFDLLGHFSVA